MSVSAAGVATSPQDRLQARLADPATIDSLNRLLDRADLLAFALEAADGFLRRSETVLESVSDSVRDVKHLANASGAGPLLEALPQLARTGAEIAEVTATPAFANLLHSGLLERLGDPRTLALLQTLFDKLETAVFLLEAVDGFLRRGDEIMDSASSLVGDLRNADVDLSDLGRVAQRTPKIIEALSQLTESHALDRVPELVDALQVLARSGMLAPDVVAVLGDVGHRLAGAYGEASAKPVTPMGTFGLLKALGEPDIQRGLGLLVAVARRFGRDLH